MAKQVYLGDLHDWPIGRRIKILKIDREDTLWTRTYPHIAKAVLNVPAVIMAWGHIATDNPIDSGVRNPSPDQVSSPVVLPNGNTGSHDFFLTDMLVEFIDDPEENY